MITASRIRFPSRYPLGALRYSPAFGQRLVDQILRLMRAVFLGGDRAVAPADPVRGPVAWSVRKPALSGGARSFRGTDGPLPAASPCVSQRVIRSIALVWALVLGNLSMAGTLAAREGERAPHIPGTAVKVDCVTCDARTHVIQTEPGFHPRSLKRHGARSKIALWHNPDCDDETSKDSDDDDDTSNDVNDDDETDVPIMFWLEDPVRYLIVLEAESAPAWTETLASPFPTYRQLRC
jgi:hypothetical protein